MSATQHDPLAQLLNAVNAYDAKLNAANEIPTGDDYNALYTLITEAAGRLAAGPRTLPYLDLSTGNLRQSTVELLGTVAPRSSMELGWPAMTIANYEEGAFISVPPEISAEEAAALPPDLVQVLTYAREHNAVVVRIDCDGGDSNADLPTYDW